MKKAGTRSGTLMVVATVLGMATLGACNRGGASGGTAGVLPFDKRWDTLAQQGAQATGSPTTRARR